METRDKIAKLESELAGYQKKLRQLESDWATGRGGSRYGDEYLETQVKVYQAMIFEIKKELLRLKKRNVIF